MQSRRAGEFDGVKEKRSHRHRSLLAMLGVLTVGIFWSVPVGSRHLEV